MATITVRALDSNGDPLQGNGQNNFLSDIYAVAQIVLTRLRLFQGEWWLNLNDGLPLFQSILGSSGSARNIEVITNLISSRISGTPYVTGISSFVVTYTNRQLIYSGVIQTQFGAITISNSPGSLTNS